MRDEDGFSRHWHFKESRFCGREWNARYSAQKALFVYSHRPVSAFSTAPLLCACTNDPDFAASNECTRPFNVYARNLYVKTLARFFSSIFTQPLSFSQFTYFCPKLSYACQPESISFGYLSAFYQLHPL